MQSDVHTTIKETFLPPSWHRTKIVCTLGPSTDQLGVLERLISNGMDVVRVNTSHGEQTDHARRILQVREIAQKMCQPVAILLDLPGPKFRIGKLKEGLIELRRGSEVNLGADDGHQSTIPVSQQELVQMLHTGDLVYLADGSVKLQVKALMGNWATCQVVVGGTIRSGSGINLPESKLPSLIPTDEDTRQITFAASQQAEWISVSFVQTADDIRRIRSYLPSGYHPLVMAKIEKRQALAELDAILEASDGVMVARGDLGVETNLAEVPLVQKRIIALANVKSRPVITATQMLESMVEHEQPTRAEVTDIANAILDGTDGVMLSAETAIGRFPTETVEVLHRVITATETEYASQIALDRLNKGRSGFPHDPISFVACQFLVDLDAKAIIVPVHDIGAALGIARFRPKAPILAMVDSESLYHQLSAVWGVVPMLTSNLAETYVCVAKAKQWLFEHQLARPGDPVVVLSMSATCQGKVDTLQVIYLSS